MPHVYVWKKLWDTNIHLTEVQNVKWAKVKGSMAVPVYNQMSEAYGKNFAHGKQQKNIRRNAHLLLKAVDKHC